MKTRIFLVAAALLAAGGCVTVPEPIRDAPADGPDLRTVQADPGRFQGLVVRWGGTIAAVTNQAQASLVEIVARPLYESGRPVESAGSPGRFLVRIPGLVDPAIYAQGRAFTAVGAIAPPLDGVIGKQPYRFQVLDARGYWLWDPLPERLPYYYDPFYYDPIWYPWSWPYRHYYPYPYRYPWRHPYWH